MKTETAKCTIHVGCTPKTWVENGFTYVEHQILPGNPYVISDRGPWTLEEIKSTFLPVGEPKDG